MARRTTDPKRDPVTLYASKRIKEYERASGSGSLSRLADISGLSVATLHDVRELKKRAGTTTQPAIARALQVPLHEFLRAAEEEFGAVAVEEEERYAVMPLIRQAAASDGIPEEFVREWAVKLDFDDQPPFSMLYDLLKASWAVARGRITRGTRSPESDDF